MNHLTRIDLADKLFFYLHRCADLLQKTGNQAIESEGLTISQSMVLGLLARSPPETGMRVADLGRQLSSNRQYLSNLLGRMERDGYVTTASQGRNGAMRHVMITDAGRHIWEERAQSKLHSYYDQAIRGFSFIEINQVLHYLTKIQENMQRMERDREMAEKGAPSTSTQ